MTTRRTFLYVSLAVFVAALGASWVTQGTGVIRNDPGRNIFIPEELTMPLQVKAAYNGQNMLFRYRWPSERPGIYHDMLKFEGGKWIRYGGSAVGPQPQGIYEDRVTMLVDDGSVPEFEKYGGYITIGDRMRFFTNEATEKEVQAHPYLGKQKKQKEVGKHLPARMAGHRTRAMVSKYTKQTRYQAGRAVAKRRALRAKKARESE